VSDHQHTFSRDRLVQKFGEQPFSLVFSGQGFNWLKTLREAVAAGAGFNVNSIVERAASLTEPVADELTAARPLGFGRSLTGRGGWSRWLVAGRHAAGSVG